MFRDRVPSTALTSEMANSFFDDKIPATTGALDVTMTTSLRYLLHDKIPDGRMYTSTCEVKSLKNADNVRSVFESVAVVQYHLRVVSVIGNKEIFGTIDEIAEEYKQNEAYQCEEPSLFRQYFRKAFDARCIWFPQARTSLIFVYGGFSASGFHFLQAALPVAIGWPYERTASGGFVVDDDVKAYSKAMASDDMEAYLALVRSFADKLNFEAAFRSKIIKDFIIGGYDREKRYIDNQIRDLNNEMDNIVRRSRELLKQINEKRIRKYGLDAIAKENAENSDFERYLNANKSVRVKSGGPGRLVFEVFTYAREFDPKAFERMLKREGSIPHTVPRHAVLTEKEAIALSWAIFVDQDVKLRLCAKFSIGDGMESYGDEPCEFNDGTYITNPHIAAFNCKGTAVAAVNKCLSEGDYIRAVDQCTFCTSDIEVPDTPVIDRFYKTVYKNAGGAKCIEFPDGTLHTMQEAAQLILAEREGEAAANQEEEHADE